MINTFLNKIGPQIKVANTLIEKKLNKHMSELLSDWNLTGPQISLLIYLYENSERVVTQKEIADRFVLSHPTIRSIVKRLEKNDLLVITQSKKDMRQVILTLSVSGQKLITDHITEIYAVLNDVDHQIVTNLTPSEQEKFSRILAQIIRNF